MAFERMAQTDAADIRKGITEARNELRSADVAFNLFWETPGLTVSRPDLGEAMKTVYLAQQAVLKQELTLLADTPQAALIERLHAMAVEKRQCASGWIASLPTTCGPRWPLIVWRWRRRCRLKSLCTSAEWHPAAILLLLVAVQRDFRRRLILPLRQIAEHLQRLGAAICAARSRYATAMRSACCSPACGRCSRS